MHLYLTSDSPWDTTYTNEEGQVIYKVEAPYKLVGRTASIQRLIPNANPRGNVTSKPRCRDRYVHIAQVKFHDLRPSEITYGGQEYQATELFKSSGWSHFGRNRVFTGPDGKEYKWKLRSSKSELITNDGTKTPVACFHRQKPRLLGKSEPSSLEISSTGEHMLDLILVTFVYIEKLRRSRQDAEALYVSGGGGIN